ncbi:hypothetical protein NLX67_17780 [Domibacillus sp. A3M-37]|uniref:hypothetical protein n=1 Tax=Domibacillus TaxID=1433999 RepID=UPI000617FD1B|nr:MULTISPECIES: hypothetical protein [Domibacillus]MCP3764200.1 hypothetical protein [Domibacillus sp. A3M-37]
MDVEVSYYRLGESGMPDGPVQYEKIEIEPHPKDDKDTLAKEVLGRKLGMGKDTFNVINITEI